MVNFKLEGNVPLLIMIVIHIAVLAICGKHRLFYDWINQLILVQQQLNL